jgi:hypothetical protein
VADVVVVLDVTAVSVVVTLPVSAAPGSVSLQMRKPGRTAATRCPVDFIAAIPGAQNRRVTDMR